MLTSTYKGESAKASTNDEQLRKGIMHEREHLKTYKWMQEYYKRFKKFPSDIDFLAKTAADHIKKIPDYYDRLSKMEDSLESKDADQK